mmetsp:Transcript_3910/g.4805  ORF Transcript_3910/g.4805 Transcript_3910/m.4805 type:complete len:124 (-) Transcript_3910:244-615(-)
MDLTEANLHIEATLTGSDEIVLEADEASENKRVSFREEMTEHFGNESESSSVTSEENQPSISSLSECSTESTEAAVRSGRSIDNNSRDMKNVLKKKYSKLAMSVHNVREGQPIRQVSLRRMKR